MTQSRTERLASSIVLLVLAGCGGDFTGRSGDVSTTTPGIEQVAKCRDVMYINPEIDIKPLGYAIETGMDDTIRFKFVAHTDDPSALFDSNHVDASRFADDFNPYTLRPQSAEAWWDLSSKSVSGANFSVPPPGSKGTRGLNIAYVKNDDNTLTVYVLWYET